MILAIGKGSSEFGWRIITGGFCSLALYVSLFTVSEMDVCEYCNLQGPHCDVTANDPYRIKSRW